MRKIFIVACSYYDKDIELQQFVNVYESFELAKNEYDYWYEFLGLDKSDEIETHDEHELLSRTMRETEECVIHLAYLYK